MICETVDELAGALALGAITPEEWSAIQGHLRICERPHAEVRRLVEVADVIPLALEPIEPPPALRKRLMATISAAQSSNARTRPSSGETGASPTPARSIHGRVFGVVTSLWERRFRLVAAGAMVAAIGLAIWGVSLQSRLEQIERVVGAIKAAESMYRVEGEAGTGWLLATDDRATFVATELTPPPVNHLYELWLIDTSGVPRPAGVIDRVDDLTLIPLDGSLRHAVTFAVTIEAHRVEEPSSEPVLVAQIGGSNP
jgi:anti-sigma-K factor RskA